VGTSFNSKNGRAAVMAGSEAQIVDVTNGKTACAPLRFNSLSMFAASSPDGKWLATASG